MADPDITTVLTDGDTIVFYRPLASSAKRKTMRTTFGELRKLIVSGISAGSQGPIGPQGIQGEGGKDGKDGASGPVGLAGASIVGPAGPQGVSGKDGKDGSAGNPGATGPSGKDGASIVGPVGPFGQTGLTGAAGRDGVQGLTGPVGPDRIKFAKTLTTAADGTLAIANVPASATVLIVSPKTDGAIQRAITRSGTTVTVSFRILLTGTLPVAGLLSSLFASNGPVTFDFVAMEPTT